MTFSTIAGVGGLGFVLVAVVVNAMYIRGRMPIVGAPSGAGLDETVADFAVARLALRRPTVLAPASWLLLTMFGAGLVVNTWTSDSGPSAWALVGMGGVLMQNVTFACVEALRFAIAEAAARAPSTVVGLWAMNNVLFGFNQVFLAAALLGFTTAGTDLFPAWHMALGYGSAALLFVSSSASPYNTEEHSRMGLIGLIGWLGWIIWIVTCSITLILPQSPWTV